MERETIFIILGSIFSFIMGTAALQGGIMFLRDPSGGLLKIDPKPMQDTYGIQTFFVPGLNLVFIYGLGSLIGAFLSFFSKTRKLGLIIQMIPGFLIWIWIFIQVRAYGWILKVMQIGVLVIGSFMVIFSFLALKAGETKKKVE